MCDPFDFDADPAWMRDDDDIPRVVYRSGSARDGFAFLRTLHGTEVVAGAGAGFHTDALRSKAEELVTSGHLARAGRDAHGTLTYTLTFHGLLALNPDLSADLRHPN